MANQAIGMIETRGLCAMLEACDAALKAANVTMVGWEKNREWLRDWIFPRRCRSGQSSHRRRCRRSLPSGGSN